MWFYIYKCKCHIYRNIQISDTNGTLYEHREARGGLGHAGAGHAHATYTNVWCTRIALHVILFEGASRSTAALHKRSTAALHNVRQLHFTTFDSCTSQTFDSCTSQRSTAALHNVRQLHFTNVRQLHFTNVRQLHLHLGDRKKIVAVPSNCADHYAFLCQTVVEWTGECRL